MNIISIRNKFQKLIVIIIKGEKSYLRMKGIYEYLLDSHNLKVCMLRAFAEVGSYMVKVVNEDFIC